MHPSSPCHPFGKSPLLPQPCSWRPLEGRDHVPFIISNPVSAYGQEHSSQTREATRPSLAETAHLKRRQHNPPTGQNIPVFKMQVRQLAQCLAYDPRSRSGGRKGTGTEGRWDGQSEHSYLPSRLQGEALLEQSLPGSTFQNSCAGGPGCWVKQQCLLPRAGGQGETAPPERQGTGQNRGSFPEEHPHLCSRPRGLAPSLARQFPDLRSHRTEQREPDLRFRGTVYLINRIFMINA